jgi:hypothetical protein
LRPLSRARSHTQPAREAESRPFGRCVRQRDPRPRRAARGPSGYLSVTVRVAEPPALLLTVTLCGFVATLNLAKYFPPLFLVSVPRRAFVDVTYAFSVAVELVLVASRRSSCFELV